MDRALREFRIRGVKTNIPFLENVVNHADFQSGPGDHHACSKRRPRCSASRPRRDRATKLLTYLGDVIVNGNPEVAGKPRPRAFARRPFRRTIPAAPPDGTRQLLRSAWRRRNSPSGPRNQKRLLVTDTTFRDAHQSLLATRVRTYDMLAIANFVAHRLHNLYSLEMWGGATFDVAMRFLHEDPWRAPAPPARSDPQHLFPDAAARLQRRRLHRLSRQRGAPSSSTKPPRRASTSSASSIR